jgi:Leucine-rich repeat (LRR) protein
MFVICMKKISDMKNILLISMLILAMCINSIAQTVYIPDTSFKKKLIDLGVDVNLDGLISVTEAKAITNLDVSKSYIKDLTGIEAFTALTHLNCSYNDLVTLDLSSDTLLTDISCFYNSITTLNVSKNVLLKSLICDTNQIQILDVSKNTALTTLHCGFNSINTLDVSKNTALTSLHCDYNSIGTLDVSKNILLTDLNCTYNSLSTLDVSKNTALESLSCGSDHLSVLDLSKNTSLKSLICSDNNLGNLDLSLNTALEYLDCQYTQLTSIDLSKNTALTNLFATVNQLTTLDLSKNTALKNLDCSDNNLTSLDVSKNLALNSLICYGMVLGSLDISKNTALTNLQCGHDQLTTLDVTKNIVLTSLQCNNNDLTSLDLSKNIALKEINISGMNNLINVCVWTMPFPPADVAVDSTDSPFKVFSACGNSGPSAAGTITGNQTVCKGAINVIYRVPAITGATSYIWTLPAGVTGASDADTISVSFGSSAVSGDIKVKGHNSFGDGTESAMAIIVNNACGANAIDDISSSNTIKVYPNPTAGLIELSLNELLENDFKIEIYNCIGSIIKPLILQKGEKAFEINLQGYPSGVYLIKINSKNISYQSRLIKN